MMLPPEQRRQCAASLDDLVGEVENRGRDRQADRLGGRQVDDKSESCRLLDRQVGRLGAFQDLGDIAHRELRVLDEVRPIAEQGATCDSETALEDRRQPVREGEVQNTRTFGAVRHRVILDQQGFGR